MLPVEAGASGGLTPPSLHHSLLHRLRNGLPGGVDIDSTVAQARSGDTIRPCPQGGVLLGEIVRAAQQRRAKARTQTRIQHRKDDVAQQVAWPGEIAVGFILRPWEAPLSQVLLNLRPPDPPEGTDKDADKTARSDQTPIRAHASQAAGAATAEKAQEYGFYAVVTVMAHGHHHGPFGGRHGRQKSVTSLARDGLGRPGRCMTAGRLGRPLDQPNASPFTQVPHGAGIARRRAGAAHGMIKVRRHDARAGCGWQGRHDVQQS
jgi:hypothetical protein